jgi:hypothetical protein
MRTIESDTKPAQEEERLEFAFALHVDAAAWLQCEATDEVAGSIPGIRGFDWAERRLR